MKKGYTVYRVDYVTGKKDAIGCILERRGRNREGNLPSLLVEARRLFAREPSEAINIVLDPEDVKCVKEAAITRGIAMVASKV